MGYSLQSTKRDRVVAAIGLNVRMGLYNSNKPFAPPRPDCFAWLDRYEPVARPGYSILVYDLPEPAAP